MIPEPHDIPVNTPPAKSRIDRPYGRLSPLPSRGEGVKATMPPKGVGFTDPLSKTLKPPFDQRPFSLTLGGLLGLVIGVGGAQLLTLFFPALPVHISWNYLIAAETLAIVIGVIAGV